jgi:hypothetical protein
MKHHRFISFTILLIISCIFQLKAENPLKVIHWKSIEKGLFVTDIAAPKLTRISDYKVTILKIDPQYFTFHLVTASRYDSLQRTVKEWCELEGLIAAINAGMYGGKSRISNVGYMKDFDHINNPNIKENYKAMAAFNSQDNTLPPFKIIDMVNEDWGNYKEKYNSFTQSMRMIDNNRKPMLWKQKYKMRSSMVVLATDKQGNVLFVFTRSPFTPNEFSDFLLKIPIQIQTAMYLEGGPESSLYVNNGEIIIEKIGSYVSRTFAHDRNYEFRKMPNVIGIKRKL